MMRYFVLFVFAFTIITASARKRDPLWVGGGVGAAFPSNLANDGHTLGFASVAVPGFRAELDARWFYATRLSLSGSLSWSRLGQKDEFWDVRNNGNVTSHYSMATALLKGHYYFSDDSFRPYVGIGFGVTWINNRMDYDSSLSGTSLDNSVSYVNRQFKPVFVPEIGFFTETGKKSFFYASLGFVVVPDMNPEYVSVKDEYGYNDVVVVQNPHGNQNHFSLTIGFLFRCD